MDVAGGPMLYNSNRMENDSSSQTTVNVIKLSHQLHTPEYFYHGTEPFINLTCWLDWLEVSVFKEIPPPNG